MVFPYVTSLSLHLRIYCPRGAFFVCEDFTAKPPHCQQLFAGMAQFCNFSQPSPSGSEKTLWQISKCFSTPERHLYPL